MAYWHRLPFRRGKGDGNKQMQWSESRRAVARAMAGLAAAVLPATGAVASEQERKERRWVEVRAVEPSPIEGGIRLSIRLTGPAEFRWGRLRQPDRVYVDISDARLTGMPYELRVGWGGVERLWARQNSPTTVRVVAGLVAPMDVGVWAASDGQVVAVELRSERETQTGRREERRAPEPSPGRPSPPEAEPSPLTITEPRFLPPALPQPEVVTGLTARNLSDNRAEVRVRTGRRLNYKVLRLEAPSRFVVDLVGGKDGLFCSPVVVEKGLLGRRAVRVGQFQESPPIYRVVVELPEGAWGEVNADDSGELVIEVMRRSGGSMVRGSRPAKRPWEGSPWGDLLVGIDPGHGGSDPGALSMVGISEKEITLDVGLRVRELLTAMGVNTAMTRRDDRRLPKEERIRFVSRGDLDLFLSIHCDAAESPHATGITTYVHGWDRRSRALAAAIQGALVRATGLPDRGVRPDTAIHRTGFYVLRNAACPAVLIEAGFVSHAPTALQLSKPEFRQRVAEGIVAGLRNYWNRVHGQKVSQESVWQRERTGARRTRCEPVVSHGGS